jgi:hypothetical protein
MVVRECLDSNNKWRLLVVDNEGFLRDIGVNNGAVEVLDDEPQGNGKPKPK